MELELLEGIFQSIGEKYLDRGEQSSTHESKHKLEKVESEDLVRVFLERREKYLAERTRAQKEKAFRKYLPGDSGYASKAPSGCSSVAGSGCSSKAGSGYSSHHASKSPSPVPPESREPERIDIRERRWLVCKSGILAVRLSTKEEPDKSFTDSIADLKSSGNRPGDHKPGDHKPGDHKPGDHKPGDHKPGDHKPGDHKPGDRTNLHLNLKHTTQTPEENNNVCKKIPGNTASNHKSRVENQQSRNKSKVQSFDVDENGMVEVELEDTGEVIRVETRFLEQARPKDKEVSDLADLEILNESEILSTLSERYSHGIYQTKLGSSLVTVNPMQQTATVCSRSNRQKRRSGGNGGLNSAHDGASSDLLINQVEAVYKKAVTTCTTQSLVMMGRSGSGKSCNLKQALAYLIETSQDLDSSRLTIDKMHAMDCLLESFCSTRTSMNTHATRIVELIELQFTKSGTLAGGTVELALPDTHRLSRSGRFAGEPTFPILYQVQAALGKSNLFFPPRLLSNNAFFTPLKEDIEISTALEDWGRVCGAMELLEFGEEEQDAFWIILAVVTNLGYITQCLENGETIDNQSIEKIAKLLGVETHDLKMVFARPNTPRTITPASSIATSTSSSRTGSPGPGTPMGALRGSIHTPTSAHGDINSQQPNTAMAENARRLAVNLYAELLSRLVKLINRSISPAHKQHCNIFIFDSPGFQNPSSIGCKPAAGFVDLCYNYLQEKLQDMFTQQKIESICTGKAARKMMFERRGSTKPILNLLEKQGSKAERSVGTRTLDRRHHGNKKVRFQTTAPGLFTLLHRAGNCPWSDDQVFLQRLTAHWSTPPSNNATGMGGNKSAGSATIMERVGDEEFVLRHGIGTNPVRYSVKGWRNISYSMGRTNLALEVLQKSSREELRIQGPIQFYPTLGLSQAQNIMTLDQVKATMSCLQVSVQVDALVQLLSTTELNFVFCLLPHNLAGLCELFKKSPGRKLNQKLVRDQIRGNQILDYLKILDCLRNRGESLPESGDLPDAICKIQENRYRTGLAGDLWSLLQIAIFNMVTNLDMLEETLSLTRSVSFPTNTLSQVIQPSSLLGLDNARISLNLQNFFS